VDLTNLIALNAKRFAAMHVSESHVALLDSVSHRLTANDPKAIYQRLEAKTGVPWFVIAVIHEREAGQSFSKSIAQGDPWNHPSIHDPIGRGPFPSFDAAALDALINCGPYAARWKDWSIGGMLTLLELYNGEGYARMGKPSPYIWSMSDQYVRGKYIRDHVYDPNVVDVQTGCAPLLARMALFDQSIKLGIAPLAAAPLPATDDVPEAEPIVHTEPVHVPARAAMPALNADVESWSPGADVA
jgi:lysozyme family protein